MSGSDAGSLELTGTSEAARAEDALREALSGIFRGLIAAGSGPQDLDSMVWEAPDPAAFHPSRHVIDLAYREVFGGFRPAVALARGAGKGLVIRARATSRPTPAQAPVWRGHTPAELGREYSPRLQVPDMQAVFSRWSEDGTAFRQERGGLDLAYGSSRFETIDLFRPAGPGRPPLWVFIHGGYWQASDKAQHAQFARGMLAAGYAVAMPNYGLAPDTPLSAIVDQIVAALRFLAGEAAGLGLDPAGLRIAGHSAGGHLAAMAATRADAPPIHSALLLSGLYDLAPLAFLPVGRLLGLDDPAYADGLSPVRLEPRAAPRVGVAVGGRESDEFKRQATDMALAWHAAALLVLEPAHHFNLLDGLNGGPLLALARATAAG